MNVLNGSGLDTPAIYVCDGSCIKNPGPGAWAYAKIDGDKIEYRHGSADQTTNNIMELTAVLEAMRDGARVVYTDSNYVVQGLSKWIISWKRSGWKTADKKPVKNLDLWMKLDALMTTNPITIKWLRGHANPDDYDDPGERKLIVVQNDVDKLARDIALGGVYKP